LGHLLEITDFHEPYLFTLVQMLWHKPSDTVPNTVPNTVSKTVPKINDTQKEILAILTQTPSLTQKQIAAALGGETVRNVKYHLDTLKSKKLIERVGSNRAGHWVVLQKV